MLDFPAVARRSVDPRTGAGGNTVHSILGFARFVASGFLWRRGRIHRRRARVAPGTRDAVYRRIWDEAASELGAELVDLSGGFLEARRGEASVRVWQQTTPLDDPVALRLALDKPLVHDLLRSLGLPVPDHRLLRPSERAAALEFLSRTDAPCVVKPASGTAGGEGVTAGVRQPHELELARRRAARYARTLLLERQAEGVVLRLLFLDGELLDVVRNLPPRLTGDGRASIERLIAAENERRVAAEGLAGLDSLDVGLDTVFTLQRSGLRLSSVLAAGRTVTIQTVTNDNRVEDNETFREPLAPELVDDARAAASVVGLRLAGVDVITPDPSRPLRDTGGVITEVNGTPGIHRHYLVADPEGATRVAVPILATLLRETLIPGHGRTRDRKELA